MSAKAAFCQMQRFVPFFTQDIRTSMGFYGKLFSPRRKGVSSVSPSRHHCFFPPFPSPSPPFFTCPPPFPRLFDPPHFCSFCGFRTEGSKVGACQNFARILCRRKKNHTHGAQARPTARQWARGRGSVEKKTVAGGITEDSFRLGAASSGGIGKSRT